MVRMVEPPSEEGVRLVISRGEGLHQETRISRVLKGGLRGGLDWALTAEFLDDAGEHPWMSLCAFDIKGLVQDNLRIIHRMAHIQI